MIQDITQISIKMLLVLQKQNKIIVITGLITIM
jgi:hypothetical protein